VNGGLVYDWERLTWPGDLLHEAGHIAVIPAALRPTIGGTQGRSKGLAFTFSGGGHPGAAGLSANRMARSPAEAAKHGVAPYRR
jgi:hypothetical protein